MNIKTYIALLLIVVFGLFSCNSVKRVLKDQQKFDQVATEVIKRGYCVTETIIEEKIVEKTVYKDRFITDTVYVDLPVECDFDTVTASGDRVILKNGLLTVNGKRVDSNTLQTIIKNHYIRDVSLENILKQEILQKDLQILEEKRRAIELEKLIAHTEAQIKRHKRRLTLIISAIVILILGRLYFKFKRFLPF